MKTYSKVLGAAMIIALASCNNGQKIIPGTYVDLNTGDSIRVIADSKTGYAYNEETKKPFYLYVDDKKDTVFTTGMVVNHKLIATKDGKYEVDESKVKVADATVKMKYDNNETKAENDQSVVKDGDYKKKVDGDKVKIKDGDYKKKVNGTDAKIKEGDTKIKIEDGVVTKRKN